jgi:ABC-type multidrug transport system permease subunit
MMSDDKPTVMMMAAQMQIINTPYDIREKFDKKLFIITSRISFLISVISSVISSHLFVAISFLIFSFLLKFLSFLFLFLL